MAYKECQQFKCAFRSRPDDCPVCPECGAGPCVVAADSNCVNCHCCEHDDGYIRKSLSKNGQKLLSVIDATMKNIDIKLEEVNTNDNN